MTEQEKLSASQRLEASGAVSDVERQIGSGYGTAVVMSESAARALLAELRRLREVEAAAVGAVERLRERLTALPDADDVWESSVSAVGFVADAFDILRDYDALTGKGGA